ncbi:MAG: FKBP-type peptidyl-prolyl cis-trans isomerase [Bacteroidales bacterium]|nr:FKBP-type peptidyl-prolyl cis-trans isomerase [Bacteroidales bacterium]
MKKLFLLLVPALLIMSCKTQKETTKSEPQFNTFRDSVSYVIGADIGKNFKTNNIDIDLDNMMMGLKDAMAGTDTLFSAQEVQTIIGKFQQEMQKAQTEKASAESVENKAKGEKFLMENKDKEGVITTASGLQYKVMREGSGAKPTAANTVEVNYEGRLLDGTIFDSSYDRGESISFRLDQVIKGWTEGLQLMNVGSMYELYIPSELGYGDRSIPGIPAGSTLIFKVELLGIK